MSSASLAFVSAVLVASSLGAPAVPGDDYSQQRDALVQQDHNTSIGGDMSLTPLEEKVNTKLKALIKNEMDKAFTTLDFPPSKNFMVVKDEIEKSELFQLVQTMPKGSILHIHDSSMGSLDFVIKNITYWPNLYFCNLTNNQVTFKFAKSVPTTVPCTTKWLPVHEARAQYGSSQAFDDYLRKCMSILTTTPHVDYPDIDAVWKKFDSYFISVGSLLTYRPAMMAYYADAMRGMVADKVTYFEYRAVLADLHELDGTPVSAEDMVVEFQEIMEKFANETPSFYGGRVIYAPPRHTSLENMWNISKLALELRKDYPKFVAGFDLVGQEDKGQPLINFIKPLLNLSAEHMPFFFHAGETNWYGEPTDGNLYDAMLLKTKRIGHGFALPKHSVVQEKVRDAGIPIEVNPISNQVLMLVDDLRDHPGAMWAATNQPMMVSSDDPGVWGALPLSHDFYEALLAFGGADADLKFLKQLAINSIQYSSLDQTRQEELHKLWSVQWNQWVTTTASLL